MRKSSQALQPEARGIRRTRKYNKTSDNNFPPSFLVVNSVSFDLMIMMMTMKEMILAVMMTMIIIIIIIIMINMQSSLIISSGFPKLTQTPTDVIVEPGKTFKLYCKAQGHPVPTLLWQKDGGRSFPAADDRRIKYAEGLEVCEIRNAQYNDSGKYTCFAKNVAGSVNASATVTVLGETDSSLFFFFWVGELLLGSAFC